MSEVVSLGTSFLCRLVGHKLEFGGGCGEQVTVDYFTVASQFHNYHCVRCFYIEQRRNEYYFEEMERRKQIE